MKKLYYEFNDSMGVSNIVFQNLENIKLVIEGVIENYSEKDREIAFTIKPVWLTDEEYNNLKEYE